MISILNINIEEYWDFVHVYFPDFAIIAVAKKSMAQRRLPSVSTLLVLVWSERDRLSLTERLIEWVAPAAC